MINKDSMDELMLFIIVVIIIFFFTIIYHEQGEILKLRDLHHVYTIWYLIFKKYRDICHFISRYNSENELWMQWQPINCTFNTESNSLRVLIFHFRWELHRNCWYYFYFISSVNTVRDIRDVANLKFSF